jgi:hypothetical protein
MILISPVGLFDTFGQRPRASLFVLGPVFPFRLRINQQQIERHRIVVVEVDDLHTATLTGVWPAPANLAQAAGVRDGVHGVGVGGDKVHEGVAIVLCR